MIAPLLVALALLLPAQTETIAEIRVHGNHVATNDEIVKIAGLTIGAPFTATTVADVSAKLKASRKFDDVEVLKRYASIEDASQITVVIVVNEGPVRIKMPGPTDRGGPIRVVKRRFGNFMWLPILDGGDGYGFTYGARIAYVGLPGDRTRLSFPLTWGGERKAGAEFDQTFLRGPISRVQVGVARQRRHNTFYDEQDDRTRVWGRAEHASGPIRLGTTAGWQRVSFGPSHDDDLKTIGADVAFDTRVDPLMPRNAVYALASVERIAFASTTSTTLRRRYDARGYLGLFAQTVLVARVLREDATRPLPVYLRSLLGGISTLRGFKTGSFTGDTLVAGSLELRVPISSPLSIAKLGVSAFVDTGTAYDHGQRFSDQTRHTGIGGSVWITLTALRMELAVARGKGAGTRVHFGGGIAF